MDKTTGNSKLIWAARHFRVQVASHKKNSFFFLYWNFFCLFSVGILLVFLVTSRTVSLLTANRCR